MIEGDCCYAKSLYVMKDTLCNCFMKIVVMVSSLSKWSYCMRTSKAQTFLVNILGRSLGKSVKKRPVHCWIVEKCVSKT